MSIPTNNIIRSATRKVKEPLNILWLPYDGIFEHLLCQNTPHNYYYGDDTTYIPWEKSLFPPKDMYELSNHNSFSLDIDFDFIVCNNRVHQQSQAQVLSDALHIPIVLIEHGLTPNVMKKEDIYITKQDKKANLYFVTSQHINDSWCSDYDVVPYGIPDLYDSSVKKIDQIIIAGNFLENDYQKIKEVVRSNTTPIKIYGDNPGLSESCTHNEFVLALQESKYFLNIATTTASPLLTKLAMSAGCVPISNDSVFTNELTKDVGFIFNKDKSISGCLKDMPNDITEHSTRGRQKILDSFSHKDFIEKWTNIFESMYTYVYTR